MAAHLQHPELIEAIKLAILNEANRVHFDIVLTYSIPQGGMRLMEYSIHHKHHTFNRDLSLREVMQKGMQTDDRKGREAREEYAFYLIYEVEYLVRKREADEDDGAQPNHVVKT